MSSPTKLDDIVTQNPTLRQLFRQAAVNQELDRRVKSLLEEPLRRHVQAATNRDGTLILIADSSAWAAKLRYQAPQLRSRLAKTGVLGVRTIRVRVAKSDVPRQPAEHGPNRSLSDATIEGLQRQAEILQDPALREALLRLAKRRKRSI